MQTELQDGSEQLRVLAALALKHLGEKCPVCEQTYDVDATRRRLSELATKRNASEAVSPPQEVMPKLLELQAGSETRLSTVEEALRQATRTAQQMEAIKQRLKDAGIEPEGSDNWLLLVTNDLTSVSERITSLVATRRDGEAFALSLSQNANIAAVAELKREILLTQENLQKEEVELCAEERTPAVRRKASSKY